MDTSGSGPKRTFGHLRTYSGFRQMSLPHAHVIAPSQCGFTNAVCGSSWIHIKSKVQGHALRHLSVIEHLFGVEVRPNSEIILFFSVVRNSMQRECRCKKGEIVVRIGQAVNLLVEQWLMSTWKDSVHVR